MKLLILLLHWGAFVQIKEGDELLDILLSASILSLKQEVRQFGKDVVYAGLYESAFDVELSPGVYNTELVSAEFLLMLGIEAVLVSEDLDELDILLELLVLGIAPE